MWRLIETDAPTGGIIENDGWLWRVGDTSPTWPLERECHRLECPACAAEPCRRDGNNLICPGCGHTETMVDRTTIEIQRAAADLVDLGLWEEAPEKA